METLKQALDLILPHWAFIAVTVMLMMMGTVMNKRLFTEKQARVKRRLQWVWWWGRKTLPLHPVIFGIMLGLIWDVPEPGVDKLVERCAYFGLAGAMSVFSYELIKGLAKKKGIDLELPGDTPEATPLEPKQ